MAVLPRAILFDLDDTLIRAYAQPEEAWTRLLHFFAAHLDAHDAAAIERVRLAIMEEARAFWSDRSRSGQVAARHPRAPGGSRCGAAWRGSATPTRRWPTTSPTPSPNCAAPSTGSIPTPTPRSTRCARRGVKLALVTNGAAEFAARQDRALRPRPSLRPYPDRGRVRPWASPSPRLPPRARAAGLRRLRCLDGRRQLRMGSRGAAEARPVRHLVRPVRGRHSRRTPRPSRRA